MENINVASGKLEGMVKMLEYLRRIRSQAPKQSNLDCMEKVQRLNGSGLVYSLYWLKI